MAEDELVQAFALEGLQPSPGRFDFEKLKWINGHVIRSMSPEELLAAIQTLTELEHAKTYHFAEVPEDEGGAVEQARRMARWVSLERLLEYAKADRAYVLQCIELERERVTTLVDFGEACEFFLVEEPVADPKAVEKWMSQEHVPGLLMTLRDRLGGQEELTVQECEDAVRAYAAANGFEKLGPVVHPTRVALTGKTVGPGLFELMAVLGPQRLYKRFSRWIG
jgi:glutamyl/glutaminyl-tRNA synthetase